VSDAPDAPRARDRYRRLADGYDASSRREWPRRVLAIERLGLQPGAAVLDVACGTGLSFAPLLARVGGNGTVVGVELSPEMAKVARSRIDAAGWRNVQLLLSDAAAVDLTPFRFDAVLFHYAHDVLQSRPALDRIFAAARPGASVVLAGIKTVHPLLVPLNVWARLRGWRYRTSSDNLDAPWRTLAPWVSQFDVESFLLGTAFVAHGRVRRP
jgi:demethylmenaquinone methyltransferase/2-methoxy-6-polyprenyl-1,4-benzoquinol methylase